MSKQSILICRNIADGLQQAVDACHPDKLFIVTDEHTHLYCLPIIAGLPCMKNAYPICIGVGDIHKNIESLAYVWNRLSANGCTRHSLLIALGGGMVTDLGGFAAATFKRGIHLINIPTTLLAMVDASVGGKTGINFNELKNEIGAFYPAHSVLISCDFLKTLDRENLLSGYAEMIKHGLICNETHWAELMRFDWDNPDYDMLQQLVEKSIAVKERIVEQDPYEKGIRKALNFGHTVGHAFESFALERGKPILHGYAVAWGMVCELYFSFLKLQFPKEKLRTTIDFIRSHYGTMPICCDDYEHLYNLMKHDKKNTSGEDVNVTLLKNIGEPCIDQRATQDEVYDMLDFFSETMN